MAVAVVLAIVALAVAAAAIVVVTHRSAAPKAPPVSTAVTVTVPVTSPAVSVASPNASALTSADMSTVLQRYVDAYTNEDVAGLRSLFASGLVRQNGSDPAEGLSQALATYRGQFAALTNPRYSLANVAYDPSRAVAGGTYAITSDSGTVGGRIAFHFVRVGDRLLIDRILIQPS